MRRITSCGSSPRVSARLASVSPRHAALCRMRILHAAGSIRRVFPDREISKRVDTVRFVVGLHGEFGVDRVLAVYEARQAKDTRCVRCGRIASELACQGMKQGLCLFDI